MIIRPVSEADIPKWTALSREYDRYILELVSDLSEWYGGNDTSPAFDEYMTAKIRQREAFIAVDETDINLGIIAFSKKHNRITFFGVSHRFDFYVVGRELIRFALAELDDAKPVYIGKIAGSSPFIRQFRELYLTLGFTFSHSATENGVPVNKYVRVP